MENISEEARETNRGIRNYGLPTTLENMFYCERQSLTRANSDGNGDSQKNPLLGKWRNLFKV
jgi:hypothetical protein